MNFFKKKTLSDRLKGEAISLGLCQQWQCEWKDNSSKDELAEKFIRGIDFAIKHDWPSPAFIKKHFDTEFRHKWGVFIDEDIDPLEKQRALLHETLVMLGECRGHLRLDRFEVKDVYIRHHGDVTIEAEGHAHVYVSIYDDVKLTCVADDGAKIFVYRYGGNVEAAGNVVVRERRTAL